MIRWLAAHPSLAQLVAGYAVVDDRRGTQGGQLVQTAPAPFGVLSANFADPSLDEAGGRHPRTAFLGLQRRARRWTAGDRTAFVMILLRPPGVMALFRDLGGDTVDALVDLDELWDRRRARSLHAALAAVMAGRSSPAALDAWLAERFASGSGSPVAEGIRIYRDLCRWRRVDRAAIRLGMSPRTLQRRCRHDLGVSPKQLLELERMQRSIRRAQGAPGSGEPDDFADQAHEIRRWRTMLATTPGRYRRSARSAPAAALSAAAPADVAPAFYL